MTANSGRADLFHTGIVVPDLDATKSEMTAAFGITWRATNSSIFPMFFHGEKVEVGMRWCYSAGGPHYLELIQAVPGTVYELSGDQAELHHIGFFADHATMTEHFEQLGLGVEAGDAFNGVSSTLMTFHRSVNSPRLELLDISNRSDFYGGDK
jgi:hypothetical protein